MIDTEVNQFPSLTWHHLHINHSYLRAEVMNEAEYTCSALSEGLTSCKKTQAELSPVVQSVATGMGKEFDTSFTQSLTDGNVQSLCVTVSSGAKPEPVLFTCKASDGKGTALDVVIEAKKESVSSFVFLFEGDVKNESALGCRVRVRADDYASVHVSFVNLLSKNVVHYTSFGSVCAEHASAELTQVELGASQSLCGQLHTLNGYKALCKTRTAWFASGSQAVDVNYVAHHIAKETESNATFSGVVSDSASKTWRGTIQFERGCVDACGEENEDVLLLSPSVVNKSMPVILCDEEAVEGHHGSSIGKLSPETLLYLNSRGIDEKTARALLIKSKVQAVSRFIPDEQVQQKVQIFLDEVCAC